MGAAAASNGAPAESQRGEYCRAAEAAWDRLKAMDRHHRAEIVFDLVSEPGTVILGKPGELECVPIPPLAGLRAAYAIFSFGATTVRVLEANDLIHKAGARRPDNALRNSLIHASDWVKTYSPSLATAFRAPLISIKSDGRVVYDTSRGPIVRMRAP